MTIPARTVPIINPEDRTGQVSRPWYEHLSNFISGTGDPPTILGNDGNFYFKTDAIAGSSIFHKENGSWVAVI